MLVWTDFNSCPNSSKRQVSYVWPMSHMEVDTMRAAQGLCSAYGDSLYALSIPILPFMGEMDSDVESFVALDAGAAEDDEEELQIAKVLSLYEHVSGNEFKSEVVRGSPEFNGYPDYLCLQTIEPGVYFRTLAGPKNDPKVNSKWPRRDPNMHLEVFQDDPSRTLK